ncbi:hypothetical protein [Streptomyces sp. NPDC060031]|uniref:hypothetical protein n=1 Tax=Streptomyces sp. NPDC060031 TaxID=3347043 RepID=UPI0036CE5A59
MTTARQQHKRFTQHRRALAAAAIVAALTAGCTTDSDDGKASPEATASVPVSTSASSRAAPTDPKEASKAEAKAAFDRYWSTLTALYARPDAPAADLNKVATGDALVQAEQELTSLRSAGQVVNGQVQHSSTAVVLKEGTKLETAVITDCVDVSQWKPIDKATGKEVQLSKTRLLRYVSTVTAEKWPTGWIVLEEKVERRAC